MTDTPETDARVFISFSSQDTGGNSVVMADFARTLERKFNEARTALLEIAGECSRANRWTLRIFRINERACAVLEGRQPDMQQWFDRNSPTPAMRALLKERDALQDELTLARKLHWLAARDFIFFGTFNSETKDWDDGAYPAINCNDVFVPGADAEPLVPADVDLFIECVTKFGDVGSEAWCGAKRSMKPWRRSARDSDWLRKFDEAKAWCEERFAARRAQEAPR